MKFSAWPRTVYPWGEVLDEVKHAEATGWDGIWIADHFMPNTADKVGLTQECLTVLAGIAAVVPRVRLGTLVVGNTYRNPAVLAKQAAQVDIISGGRLILGMGAGWQENEHDAYDIPFYTVGGRLRRLEESVQVLRSLFDNERTDFEGRYYKIKDAPLTPKPVQAKLPLLIGGGGEKKTMRIAAQYADEWNTWGRPSTLTRKGAVLEQHCSDLGRDPASIKRSCQALVVITDDKAEAEAAAAAPGMPTLAGSVEFLRDAMGQYQEAKINEFILPDFNMGPHYQKRIDTYDRFMEEVAAKFQD
jgi:F420-dependent oxidoreductase-like protein